MKTTDMVLAATLVYGCSADLEVVPPATTLSLSLDQLAARAYDSAQSLAR